MQACRHVRRAIFRILPFPYKEDCFPRQLGALVQRAVLAGDHPVREVIHAPDGSWMTGDGVNDPNPPGACVVTHIAHAVERNSSIAGLASMPPGHIAQRGGPDEPWHVTALAGWDDD